MTKIVSTFSTGHTDTYKGKRDVKAGWMITGPQGDLYTGHSQNRITARKTAEGRAPYLKGAPSFVDRPARRAATVAYFQYFAQQARKHGFTSHKAWYDDYAAKMAAFRAQCRVEIVDL
jgi:hypothetical protein